MAALVGLVLTTSAATGHAGTGVIVDEGFKIDDKLTQGVVGRQAVTLMEQLDYTEIASALRGFPNRAAGRWRNCDSLSSPNCAGVDQIEFAAVLKQCGSPTQTDCIVDFGMFGPGGTKIPATFGRYFPAEPLNKYDADDSKSLPQGGTGSLWTLPVSSQITSPLHYVRASVTGQAKPGTKFTFTGFTAGITPVAMTSRQCRISDTPSVWDPCTPGDYPCTINCTADGGAQPFWGAVAHLGDPDGTDCVMTGNSDAATDTVECAARKPASIDVSYYLVVRLSQAPQGWLHGRLGDPDLSITEISEGIELSVKGKPIRVPAVFKEQAFADLPIPLKEKYASNGAWPSSLGGSGYKSGFGLPDVDPSDGTKRNRNSIPPSYGPDGIEELKAWMPYLNDTSTADRSTWSVRTLSSWEREQANPCIADKTRVTGIVVTNATQYKAGAPELNPATRALEYKVAAPHFMSSGDVLQGTYHLIMRSDVARCIYKFTKAPIRATVEVIEDNGATRTAVTSFSESGGWVRLSATGFTFSAPTVRATLTQDSEPASVSVPTGTQPAGAASSMKVKSSLTLSAVAKKAGLKVTGGSRVTVQVNSSSRKSCRVTAGKLHSLKKGTCKVSVVVTSGRKRATKVLSIAVL